jgi:hypothetical protein
VLQSSNSKCNEGAADGVADGDGLKLGKSVFDIVELSSLSVLSDGVADGDGLKLGKSVFDIVELSSLSALSDGVTDGDGLGKSVFNIGSSTCSKELELSSLSALFDDGLKLGKSVLDIRSSACSKEIKVELSSLSALFDDFDFPFFCDFDALDFLCKRRRDSLIFVVASSEVSAWTISCLTIVCFNDSESSYRPSFASDTEIHLK